MIMIFEKELCYFTKKIPCSINDETREKLKVCQKIIDRFLII